MAYATQDVRRVERIKNDLIILQGIDPGIQLFDIEIIPGMVVATEKERQLREADLILLMVSQDFLVTEYCRGSQGDIAMQRHENEGTWVIPILLRPSIWHLTKLGQLKPLPKNYKAVADSFWKPKDQAFVEIALGIREAIQYLQDNPPHNIIPFRKPS